MGVKSGHADLVHVGRELVPDMALPFMRHIWTCHCRTVSFLGYVQKNINAMEIFSDYIYDTCKELLLYAPRLELEDTVLRVTAVGTSGELAVELEHIQKERGKRKTYRLQCFNSVAGV